MTLWDCLSQVETLTFRAHSSSSTGWNGSGQGRVTVEREGRHRLIFSEAGTWTPDGAGPISFRNVFRWTMEPEQTSLHLEHLRFGPDQPVYLFQLQPVGEFEWRTVVPHACGQDTYDAILRGEGPQISIRWTIQGPNKNETLLYTYAPADQGLLT